MYRNYNGGEDQKLMPNPAEQETFEQDFKEMITVQKEQAKEYPYGLQASLDVRD